MGAKRSDVSAVAALVERVAVQHRATAAAVLQSVGASEATGGLLWLLSGEGVDTRMKALARQLNCDPSNVTLMADQLERLELAERVQDERDGRQRRLRLTAKGQELADRMLRSIETTSPLGKLTVDERKRLIEVLTPDGPG